MEFIFLFMLPVIVFGRSCNGFWRYLLFSNAKYPLDFLTIQYYLYLYVHVSLKGKFQLGHMMC